MVSRDYFKEEIFHVVVESREYINFEVQHSRILNII